jgi:hypothetical protein
VILSIGRRGEILRVLHFYKAEDGLRAFAFLKKRVKYGSGRLSEETA